MIVVPEQSVLNTALSSQLNPTPPARLHKAKWWVGRWIEIFPFCRGAFPFCRGAFSFWTMLACQSLTFIFLVRKGAAIIFSFSRGLFPIFMTTWLKQELNSYKEALEHFFLWNYSVFDPLSWMVLAIQSALYKTHKHCNDQDCVLSAFITIRHIKRGAFYWCWSSLNYLCKILITTLIRFSIHIWKLNSEDQQTTAIRTANHIPGATPHHCEAMDKFHPECSCSCRMKLIIFTTFEK